MGQSKMDNPEKHRVHKKNKIYTLISHTTQYTQ